ncbi:MAG TPA: energy transducer TonB [Edaphobacter sp.]
MDFLVPPQEISYRYGDYVEEFQSILAASSIKFGSPDNFSAFARRLQSDALLSADLDRMVRSIIQRESGNISLRTILNIIAVASGGHTITEPHRDFSNPMQLVIDAMIASGGCSPDDAAHLDHLCRSTPTTSLDDDLIPIRVAPDLNQSLTRIERNVSEAIHYLDSIEQRITRMEPFLETLPFCESSPPTVAPAAPPATPFIPADPPTHTNHIRIILDDSIDRFADFLFSHKFEFPNFSTDTFTIKSFQLKFTDKLSSYTFTHKLLNYRFTDKHLSNITHKLASYRFTDKRFSDISHKLLSYRTTHKLLNYRINNELVKRGAAVPLSLAAIVGTTLLYLSIERKTHVVIQPPTAPTTEASTLPLPITIPTTPQLTVTDTPQYEPTAKPQSHKPSPYSIQTATIIPNHPQPQHQTEPAAVTPSSSTVAAVTPSPATNTTTEDETPILSPATSAHSVRYALTSLPSKLRLSPSHTIDVSSGVMASNLVSANPPTYPKLASLTHMHGKVVMQAIIAKNGTVQSLQVLQGHHLLRSAAKNAVRSWRYRPYLIDDRPVEVATIVTVDFNLQN